MDKQQKYAIKQMIVAVFIGAMVVIPALVACSVASKAEQAEQAKVEPKVTTTTATPKVMSYWESVPLDKELQNYIVERSHANGIPPQIVMAMIYKESTYIADNIGDGGNSYGLMQIQPRWHYERMADLGCTNLLDEYQNVTVGIDYLAELLNEYGDIAKALTAYNRGSYSGTVTEYAKAVLAKADELGGANVYGLY
jgi:soluble lytic murein transglycosylase-like protein